MPSIFSHLAPALMLTVSTASLAAEAIPGIPESYQLVYSQDFSKPEALQEFTFTDPSAWKITTVDGKSALELTKQSAYKPPFRSPVNIARLTGKKFGDVIIEAECLQTGREYGHRDMVFVYGYQSPSQFYYTHIATAADDHAHNCFIVNNAARVKFAKSTTKGVDWGLNVWRKVRIERKASDGTVRVFFEDLKEPIMVAEDKSFGPGEIGFGSFDDTGKITNIRVYAPAEQTK
ncbi:MAG: hypothetical protein EOP84_11990 [Verrucomicrobiaceae bacterium]|nr:MAG: hypothetical protein EOP84_11990 [Verrucomicrobiaceae bacterium]